MPILCSNRNLLRRDANGQFRKTYLFITPRISNKYNTTIFSHSANSVSRIENCSKITRQTVRDLGFHRLEVGCFFPSGSDFSALRLEESRQLANLSGNRYLSDSDIFRTKLQKIRNKTDRYLRAYPTPSQVLEYSKWVYQQIREGDWDEHSFFLPIEHPPKIWNWNWRWRHETPTTNKSVSDRYGLVYLPPMEEILSSNDTNFRWAAFLGDSEESKANRLLRDKIVSRFLDNLENEQGLMCDDERQFENGVLAEYEGAHDERLRLGRLSPHFSSLREITNPNALNDVEISLEASHETQSKFYAKRGEKQPRQTSWKGESREIFPYFWSTIFTGNCDSEASLNINLSSGHRQVLPIQRFPSETIIDDVSDQPQCIAVPLYPKDEKLASISLLARSYGLCLGRNRTAALVSRNEYCQKVPAELKTRRSCLSEGLSPCHECLRYGEGYAEISEDIQKFAAECLSSTIDTNEEKENLLLRTNVNPSAPIKDLLRWVRVFWVLRLK